MEGMNLEKLEALVEKMLANLQEMKRENASLQTKLETKSSRIEELEARIKAMTTSQEEVSSRVTNLLSSIEEWEKSVTPDEAPEGREEFVESKGGGLFSLGE